LISPDAGVSVISTSFLEAYYKVFFGIVKDYFVSLADSACAVESKPPPNRRPFPGPHFLRD
jgi:hypothetical protein